MSEVLDVGWVPGTSPSEPLARPVRTGSRPEAVVEYAARTAPPSYRLVIAGAERLLLSDNAYDVMVPSMAFTT
ncbi:MAG: hypothetical protein WBA97_06015 [Actinophytocola sp.]|uniref:hypothetical protein n=1 Tax=Actinophytocola sp. TaxID=1872138 RepID=UPI003C7228EA